MSRSSDKTGGATVVEYYQIGGFGCSFNYPTSHPGSGGWITTKQLADMVFGLDIAHKTGVDLVFGVTPCGASYLLVPRTPALDRSRFNPQRVYVSSGFVSLSPVHFDTVDALKHRLDELENKRKNKGIPSDRSKMNKGFTEARGGDPEHVLSEAGQNRAFFEYQRLLVRVSREEPDIDYRQFAIDPPKWRYGLRIISFTYNCWSYDNRSKYLRGDDLMFLDVGWTVFNSPDFAAQATTHIKMQENILLSNKNPAKFLHGETEVLQAAAVRSRLQAVFATEDERDARPIVLLVSDEEKALHALRVLGVDKSSWHIGIEPLLGLKPLTPRMEFDKRLKSGHVYPRRPRDLSPSREARTRARSPVRTPKSSYPVYVVDVGMMYRLATGQPAATLDWSKLAAHVRVNSGAGDAGTGWCAGNESRLLGELWHKMVTGNALEEQKIEWQKRVLHEDTEPLASGSGAALNSDDEMDPNDPAPNKPASVQSSRTKAKDPYEELEDDDDDW